MGINRFLRTITEQPNTGGGRKNRTPPTGVEGVNLAAGGRSRDQLSAPITASMRFFMVEASNGLMM